MRTQEDVEKLLDRLESFFNEYDAGIDEFNRAEYHKRNGEKLGKYEDIMKKRKLTICVFIYLLAVLFLGSSLFVYGCDSSSDYKTIKMKHGDIPLPKSIKQQK